MTTNEAERARDPKIKTPCPSCGNQTLFVPEHGLLTCSVIGCKAPAMLNDMAMERRKQMEAPAPSLAERFPVGRQVRVVRSTNKHVALSIGKVGTVEEVRGEIVNVCVDGGPLTLFAHEIELLPEDPTPAPWVPKVGERVRFLPSAIDICVPATVIGHCGIVRSVDGEVFEVECDVEVSNNRLWYVEAEHIEPECAPTPKPTGPGETVEESAEPSDGASLVASAVMDEMRRKLDFLESEMVHYESKLVTGEKERAALREKLAAVERLRGEGVIAEARIQDLEKTIQQLLLLHEHGGRVILREIPNED